MAFKYTLKSQNISHDCVANTRCMVLEVWCSWRVRNYKSFENLRTLRKHQQVDYRIQIHALRCENADRAPRRS